MLWEQWFFFPRRIVGTNNQQLTYRTRYGILESDIGANFTAFCTGGLVAMRNTQAYGAEDASPPRRCRAPDTRRQRANGSWHAVLVGPVTLTDFMLEKYIAMYQNIEPLPSACPAGMTDPAPPRNWDDPNPRP